MKRQFFKTILACTLIISMVLPIAGCSDKISVPNLMDGIKAQNVGKVNDLKADSADITDFAIRLFNATKVDDKNTLISPTSVLLALAMTANGADGETLAQMEEVFGVSRDVLNEYLNSYKKALPQGDKYKLHMANSIWFKDQGFTVKEDFLQTNANYYGADIFEAPFDNSTLKDINNWVKNETDEMIPEVLDSMPKDAIMYLINALAFEAEWDVIYKENEVRNGKFTLEGGTKQDVEFMYSDEYAYLEDDNAKGFIKYYKDKKYAFVALLPDEGMTVSEYMDTLDGEKLNTLLSNPKDEAVRVAIPKFEVEYDIEMAGILKNMGMTDAFDDEEADFTSLGTCDDGANIYIGRVLHKTFISVDEKGTKAGAATVVEIMKATGMIGNEVYLNRPFVYMLIDCETNIPFFVGTMMNVKG